MNYLNIFSGRINRRTFILSWILVFVFQLILIYVAYDVSAFIELNQTVTDPGQLVGLSLASFIRGGVVAAIIVLVIDIFLRILQIGLVARRLGDIGWTKWLSIIFVPALILSALRFLPLDPFQQPVYLQILGILVPLALILAIVVIFVRGKEGHNEYGEQPQAKQPIWKSLFGVK